MFCKYDTTQKRPLCVSVKRKKKESNTLVSRRFDVDARQLVNIITKIGSVSIVLKQGCRI